MPQTFPVLADQEAGTLLQSCSDSCAGFRSLAQHGWPDYDLCENPRSPLKGAPVRVGRECAYAVPLSRAREA